MHIITSLKMGGAETALHRLISHKAMRQHEHTILYIHDGPIRGRIEAAGFRAIKLSGLFFLYDIFLFFRAYFWVKKLNPDLIHTALWSANILGRLVGKACSIPVISDLHGQASREGFLRNKLERLTKKFSNTVVAVSYSVARDYKQIIGSEPLVIQNGIDCADCLVQASCGATAKETIMPGKHFVVGAVGRLEPIKAYDRLIRAMALFLARLDGSCRKQIMLCIVGDGSERVALEALAQELGIAEQVFFAGQQSNSLLWYTFFDCFVLSSESEGLSLALLEACALGVPVITTHDSQEHDVVIHGVNGLLVHDKKPEALAGALQHLYNNPDLRRSMSERCKKDARRYDLSQTAAAYLNLYENYNKKFYKNNANKK